MCTFIYTCKYHGQKFKVELRPYRLFAQATVRDHHEGKAALYAAERLLPLPHDRTQESW